METKYNFIANQNHLELLKLLAIHSPNLASLIYAISHFINNYIYYVTLSAWSANKSAYDRRIEQAKG